MTLRRFAQQLLNAGLCALPANVRKKYPALNEWKHFQERLPTAKEADAMFGSARALCIVTGRVSGNLELLDFDVKGEKFDAWAALVRQRAPGLLERCFIERSQSGGKHVVYRCQEPVEGSMKLAMRVIDCDTDEEQEYAGKKYKPRRKKDGSGYEFEPTLIETKGEGGLLLCAPSPGYIAEQGDLTQLPVLMPQEHALLIDTAIELDERPAVSADTPAVGWTHQRAPRSEERKADGSLRPGDDFNERGDIRDTLRKHGWTLWRPGENEYWTRPGKSMGTGATFKNGVFYVFTTNAPPFETNTAYDSFGVFTLLEHNGDFKAAAKQLTRDGFGTRSTKQHAHSEVEMTTSLTIEVEDEGDDVVQRALEDPGPVPSKLLSVPGFINEVMDHTLACAPYPEPVLAFSGALALQSVLAGRCVRDSQDNRPSLYIVSLANTGTGKEFPRKVNQNVLAHAGLGAAIGDGFASGEGIEDRLEAQPSVLFQTDEMDTLIQAIAGKRGQQDARYVGIMQVLLKMSTSASSTYTMRVKAAQPTPRVIDQPCLVLFGTAIPSTFYHALSPRMLSNGFFSRMHILEAGLRGQGQEADLKPIPKPLIQIARHWSSFQGPTAAIGNRHEARLVDATNDARSLLTDIRIEADRQYSICEQRGDQVGMALWSRAVEKTRRLALNHACSVNCRTPKVTKDGVQWAWELVIHQTHRMLFRAGQHVSNDDFEGRCKSMLRVLQEWASAEGETWMPFWKLSRKLMWEPYETDKVREVLLDQRRIEYREVPTGGPARKEYRLVIRAQ